MGTFAIASFTSSNALTTGLSHLKFYFSLKIFTIGFMVSTNSGTKFLRNLIWLKKDLIPLWLTRRHNYWIAFTLSKSILIPSLETVCPNSFPSVTTKIDFLGFNEMPCSLHFSSTFLKSFRCFFSS